MIKNAQKGTVLIDNYEIRHLPTFYKNSDFRVFFNPAKPFKLITLKYSKEVKRKDFKNLDSLFETINLQEYQEKQIKAFYDGL